MFITKPVFLREVAQKEKTCGKPQNINLPNRGLVKLGILQFEMIKNIQTYVYIYCIGIA
jgi:hypothetical protein